MSLQNGETPLIAAVGDPPSWMNSISELWVRKEQELQHVMKLLLEKGADVRAAAKVGGCSESLYLSIPPSLPPYIFVRLP